MCSSLRWLSPLILLTLAKCCAAAPQPDLLEAGFSSHRVVQPTLYHARTKRELSSTRDVNGAHHPEVTMMVTVCGEEYILNLWLNEDLMAAGYTIAYQEDGKTVLQKPRKEEIDLCHYSGVVQGKPGSWAAVSTCHGVHGTIFDGQKTLTIESAEVFQSNHVNKINLFDDHEHKDLDVSEDSTDDGRHTQNMDRGDRTRIKRATNDIPIKIRAPYNSNNYSRYIEVLMVADHGVFVANNHSISETHYKILQLTNIVNSMFAPLNIYVALVGVLVWSEKDEIKQASITETVDYFNDYRRHHLIVEMPHDIAVLLTQDNKPGTHDGWGHRRGMCQADLSCAVAKNSSNIIQAASTVARKIANTLDVPNDSKDCHCTVNSCIMNAGLSLWSSCSIKEFKNKVFKDGEYLCLLNKPTRFFSSGTCGNGFVEPGEQCDCGVGLDAATRLCRMCCTAKCRLQDHAKCATGECCNLETCRLKSAAVACRETSSECGLTEYCTGDSEYCPDDVHKNNGVPCGKGNEQAYCFAGSCRSHNAQCRTLWGPDATSSHRDCYDNSHPEYAEVNCGYDLFHRVFRHCDKADVLCGKLQCNTNVSLPIYTHYVWSDTAWSKKKGKCGPSDKYVTRYPGLSNEGDLPRDPGLVADGARCGQNKMCLEQKCVNVPFVSFYEYNYEYYYDD